MLVVTKFALAHCSSLSEPSSYSLVSLPPLCFYGVAHRRLGHFFCGVSLDYLVYHCMSSFIFLELPGVSCLITPHNIPNRRPQEYVSQLSTVRPEALESASIKLVIIGCGDWLLINNYRGTSPLCGVNPRT